MRIEDVETSLIDRYLYVRIHTNEGLVGLGESGTWGYLEASKGAVETFRRYLIGRDPLRIEHHWQYMYRNSHFRGAAIMGAISAIDIALWDIAGKHFNVPAYQLLGGKCRDKARVYAHVSGGTIDELIEECVKAKKMGFTAVGHLSPFLDEPREQPYKKTHAQKISEAAENVRLIREAVGNEVDLCIEIHRRLNPAEAVALAGAIELYKPFFFEDPVPPDNLDAMAHVANHVNIPIATGERLHTIHEFEMLLQRCAVHYVRPDVCMVGGLSHAKKIASLAEANYAGVVPHNPLSPVSTAACLQLAACIPNFAIQEYPLKLETGKAQGDDLLKSPLEVEGGYLIVPDKPGIGVELNDEALDRHPHKPRRFVTRLHEDGSVIDQ